MQQTTKNRFRRYIDREQEITRILQRIAELGADITRIVPADEGETYDRIVVMPAKRAKVEYQITEPADFERFGDIRLDMISAFHHIHGSPFVGRRRIRPGETDRFLSWIKVSRWGKLYESEADTLAFWIPDPVAVLWLFSMPALKRSKEYFISHYGAIINRKVRESWESCFVPVAKTDPVLNACGVTYSVREEVDDGFLPGGRWHI